MNSILDATEFQKDVMFFLGSVDELKKRGLVEGEGYIELTDEGRKQYRVLKDIGHTLTEARITALIGVLSDGVDCGPPPKRTPSHFKRRRQA